MTNNNIAWWLKDHLKDNRSSMTPKAIQAFEEAILIIEGDVWHDLRKNPDDLPDHIDTPILVAGKIGEHLVFKVSDERFNDGFNVQWTETWIGEPRDIAWTRLDVPMRSVLSSVLSPTEIISSIKHQIEEYRQINVNPDDEDAAGIFLSTNTLEAVLPSLISENGLTITPVSDEDYLVRIDAFGIPVRVSSDMIDGDVYVSNG